MVWGAVGGCVVVGGIVAKKLLCSYLHNAMTRVNGRVTTVDPDSDLLALEQGERVYWHDVASPGRSVVPAGVLVAFTSGEKGSALRFSMGKSRAENCTPTPPEAEEPVFVLQTLKVGLVGSCQNDEDELQRTAAYGQRGRTGFDQPHPSWPTAILSSATCCSLVEVMGLEPTNLLTASQALYQLSYTPAFRGDLILA